MSAKRHGYAKLAIGLPIDELFTYSVPEDMRHRIKIGARALVPFGYRKMIGYVVRFIEEPDVENIKSIASLIDTEPILDTAMLKLTQWISDYYISSLGIAIEAALPTLIKNGREVSSGRAPATLKAGRRNDKDRLFLLQTDSGKARYEIYMKAIEETLSQKKGCIILMPDVSSADAFLEILKTSFGKRALALHSRQGALSQLNTWETIRQGDADIIVGVRSAVFAPLTNLGLIIVHDEHMSAYKQDQPPRYNVRELAIRRAQLTGSKLILSSMTPSMESYYLMKKKNLLPLRCGHDQGFFPLQGPCQRKPALVIDMKNESPAAKGSKKLFSRFLERRLTSALAKGERSILFLNRRGFSSSFSCERCGETIRCKNCSISLTYHQDKNTLLCHLCGFAQDAPSVCPKCSSSYIKSKGLGIEKLESETNRLFPQAVTARIDGEVLKKNGDASEILKNFNEKKVNVLIGTEALSAMKFPLKADMICATGIDGMLGHSDFRASERAFQVLSHMGSLTSGDFIIQTYNPTNYVISNMRLSNYDGFYKEELRLRKELSLPPYASLIQLKLRGKDKEKTDKAALHIHQLLSNALTWPPQGARGGVIEFTQFSHDKFEKIRRQYRLAAIIKCKKSVEIQIKDALRKVLKECRLPSGVVLAIDIL